MVDELFKTPGAGQEGDINAFAADVDSDQRMEIDRMRAMLGSRVIASAPPVRSNRGHLDESSTSRRRAAPRALLRGPWRPLAAVGLGASSAVAGRRRSRRLPSTTTDPRAALKPGIKDAGHRREEHDARVEHVQAQPASSIRRTRPATPTPPERPAGAAPAPAPAPRRPLRAAPAAPAPRRRRRRRVRRRRPRLRQLRPGLQGRQRRDGQLPRLQHLQRRGRPQAQAGGVDCLPGRPGRRVDLRQPAVHVGRADARPHRLRHPGRVDAR